MQDLDERMVHQYKVPLARMHERLGRATAALVHDQFPQTNRVLLLIGSGNTGGAGLVAARILAHEGHDVRIVLSRAELFLKPVAKVKFEQLPDTVMVGLSEEASDAELRDLLRGTDLVVDALLGYGVAGAVRGEVARLIGLVNDSGRPVLSLDLPSGIDANEGVVGPSIRASAILAIALPKSGLTRGEARERVGDVYAADIEVPDAWFTQEEVPRPDYGPRGYVLIEPSPQPEPEALPEDP